MADRRLDKAPLAPTPPKTKIKQKKINGNMVATYLAMPALCRSSSSMFQQSD